MLRATNTDGHDIRWTVIQKRSGVFMIGQTWKPFSPFILESETACFIQVCDGCQPDRRTVQYATGMTIGIRIVWTSISFRNAAYTYYTYTVHQMPLA